MFTRCNLNSKYCWVCFADRPRVLQSGLYWIKEFAMAASKKWKITHVVHFCVLLDILLKLNSPLHPCYYWALWWLQVFLPGHIFSFSDQQVQISSGCMPFAVAAMSTDSSYHFVIASSGVLLTSISDAPLPSLHLSAVNLHTFGIQFFIIVPLAGRPFYSNASKSASFTVHLKGSLTWVPFGNRFNHA